MNFYLSRDGQQYGPYPLTDLPQMRQAGQVVDTDLIFLEGAAAWEPVAAFLEKQRAQEGPPPLRRPPALPPPLPVLAVRPAGAPGAGSLAEAPRPMVRVGDLALPAAEVEREVLAGGRFVLFQYCISILVMTFKRPSDIIFLKGHEDGAGPAVTNSLISLVAGWWGFPWGPIWTIATVATNAGGGKDVTQEVLTDAFGPQHAQSIMARRQRPAPVGKGLKIFRWSLIALMVSPILLIALSIAIASLAHTQNSRVEPTKNPAINPTPAGATRPAPASLSAARQGFRTTLVRREKAGEPVPAPPPNLFRLVRYASPGGEMSAYVSPPPPDGKKRPAIIWLFGGFSNSIGEEAWKEGSREDDQSASAFRKAGILMMYPSLRGGNTNPGHIECLYGEVDDVLAARAYLAGLDYVDSRRVYLGGHSTGGTLALLVAESSDQFRAVFSFGPVEDVGGYGRENLTFNARNRQELALRAPVKWLESIQTPTYVIEGSQSPGNISSLRALARATSNRALHFHPVNGADHFSTLQPVTRLIARKILADTGEQPAIAFTSQELTESLRQ